MIEILAVAILTSLSVYVCLDIGRHICRNFFSRSTETQTRRSDFNPNKIEPDVDYATKPVIDKDFWTSISEEELNQQSFLRLTARLMEGRKHILFEKESLANQVSLLQSQLTDSNSKLRQSQNELAITKSELEENKREITDMKEIIHDKTHIVLEKEGLANQVSLLQSQLTDANSKLRKYQNVLIDLGTTKIELEEKKREIIEMKKKNLHSTTNDDSQLRRKLEDTNRLLASSQEELENLRVCLAVGVDEQLDKVNELAVAKCELESKDRTITELEEKNIRLVESESQLRRKMEQTNLLLQSSVKVLEEKQASINSKTNLNHFLLHQISKMDHEKEELLRKLAEMEDNQKQMKPKSTEYVGSGRDEVDHHRIEQPIPPDVELSEIEAAFLASGFTDTVPTKSPITASRD